MALQQTEQFNERRKEALSKIKIGFSGLFKSIDDNLSYFAPEADDDPRAMFLEEPGFKEQREDLGSLVEAMLELFSVAETPSQAQAMANEKAKEARDLKIKNLAVIAKEANELERSYRELALFYINAGPNKLENVTIINVDRNMMRDSDDQSLTEKVNEILADPHLRIDQDQVYSMLVMPGFLGEKLITAYADIAQENKVLFLTDYKDMPSVQSVVQYRQSPTGEKIGGSQKSWSHAVVFTNWVRLRDKYANLEDDAMYGSPSMAITGKLYASKISQPAAGIQYGDVKTSSGLRFRPNQIEVGAMSKLGLNPLADFYQQDSPWEATTLFNGENPELKHYAVVRTIDWIDKTLKHYLGKYTFELLDTDKRNVIHKRLVKFLRDLQENRIIEKGEVTHFDRNKDRPDRVDLNFKITPMWATRTFVYKIGIDKGEKPESEIG